MMEIKKFVELMTGEFDNKEQFMEMKEAGKLSVCTTYKHSLQ